MSQVPVEWLLQKAYGMFPEGQGGPRAFAEDGDAKEKTNELLENALLAIEKLFKQRGYDPKKPEEKKARLGYALDTYEAAVYLLTGAMHLPLISQLEAWTIGKRITTIIGASGPIGSKLIKLRKRGKAAAPQIAALLQAPSTLNLAPPPRKSSNFPPPPPPPPAPPPPPPVPPVTEQPCTRATAAAATPLQRRYGVPATDAWGPDEADVPDDPQPSSPEAPAAARAQLSEPWLLSRDAAQAIIAASELEVCYENLDGGCTQVGGTPIEVEIDIATVRYKHALRRLQAAMPAEVPELVLEPRMADELNSMPCPYDFGRLVRRPWAMPWALHLPALGLCDYRCMCGALLRARDDVVIASGVGWPGLLPGKGLAD